MRYKRTGKIVTKKTKDGRRVAVYADYRVRPEMVGHGVCPYCGKFIIGKGTEFCSLCTMYGNDIMYRNYGQTTGWNNPPRKKVAISDGWRGRVVSGNTTSSYNEKVLSFR